MSEAFIINLGKHIALLTKKNHAKRGRKIGSIDPMSDAQRVRRALPKVLDCNPVPYKKVIARVAKHTGMPRARASRALYQCKNIERSYGWWWLNE